MRLVCVDWIDSHTESDWQSLDDAKKAAADKSALTMHTVGHLVVEGDDYLLVAGTWSPGATRADDMVNGTMQIPRVCVTEVRTLHPGV